MKRFLNSRIGFALMLVAMLLAFLVTVVIAARPSIDLVDWDEEAYLVRSGDTLWSLSGEYCPASVSRSEWVDRVQDLNDLTSSIIYPGDVLTLLAPADGR